jgi:hypothetical protein
VTSPAPPSADAAPGAPAPPGAEPVPPGTQAPAGTATGMAGRPDDGLATSLATAGPLAESPASEVPHLDLRPMTVADILDGAFTIIKARPVRIFGITALFVVPVYLFMAYLQRDLLDTGLLDIYSSDPAVVTESSEDTSDANTVSFLMLVLPSLALVGVATAIGRMVRSWSDGQDPPAGTLLAAVGRASGALLVSWVIVHLAEAASFLACFIPIIFVMPLFAVTAPVIGVEGAGPFTAIKRSCTLAGRRYWPVVGESWLIGVVAWLLSNALGGLPQALVAWFGVGVAWPLLAVGNVLGAMITTPFVAAATVLLYLDLRVRTEGLDLELAARDLAADAADAP